MHTTAKAVLFSSLAAPPLKASRGCRCSRHCGDVRGRCALVCRMRASLHGFDSIRGLHTTLEHAEAALYTLVDAVIVAADVVEGGGGSEQPMEAAQSQKSGGWFGFISEALEVMLKARRFLRTYEKSLHVQDC